MSIKVSVFVIHLKLLTLILRGTILHFLLDKKLYCHRKLIGRSKIFFTIVPLIVLLKTNSIIFHVYHRFQLFIEIMDLLWWFLKKLHWIRKEG